MNVLGDCRRGRARFAAGLIVAGVAVLSTGATAGSAAPRTATPAPTLAQLVGQRLVVAMSGTQPDASLLARVRAGQVGGVILFGSNVVSPAQLTKLTGALQAAAQAGGQPRLLIATDQEGGLVKRLPWAPPNRSAQQLGALPTAQSGASGSATAAALRKVGVNVDLAPVADVPSSPASFIERQQRAFSSDRFTVARDATAFADGLKGGRVWPAMKHFPGLGRAAVSTDDALVRITASKPTLVRGLLPYTVAFRHTPRPMVMLSTAVYPALDWRAAAWSPPIIQGLLRSRLGFAGVTITDSLDAAAAVRHETVPGVALRSAQAGADLLLITRSEATSKAAFARLLTAARAGDLPMSGLTASYARILALKQRL